MADMADRISSADTALNRRLQRLGLEGHEDSWLDRYVLCNHLVSPQAALPRQKFEATARFIRDLIAHRWARTRFREPRRSPSACTTCPWSSSSGGRCVTT